MNKIKLFCFSFLIIMILYFGYQYYNYTKYIDLISKEWSKEFTTPFINYWSQNNYLDLSNSQNYDKMTKWIKVNYGIVENRQDLFDSGYNIKFDKKSKFYLLVLYGEDKKISKKNIAINDVDDERSFSIPKPTFVQYLAMDKDYDIVLLAFKKKE